MQGDNNIWYTLIVLFVITIIFGSSYMITTASGASAANDTITIAINVSEKTMVDINPNSLTWNASGIFPGSVADNNSETNNYGNVWIENIGSMNITKIWFNNSYPSQNPFGSGNPALYDPANFVFIANTSSSSFYYINRVEYRETDSMYIRLPGGEGASDSNNLFGRFRNNSYEYFFFVQGQYANNCTAGTLRYSTSPHTLTGTGDADLSDNTGYVLQSLSSNWSITNVTFGTEQYCFASSDDCTKAMFHRWNADAPGAGTGLCSNIPGYFQNSSLVPGNVSKAWIKAAIPYGVPYWSTLGTATSRTLTVFVDIT